MENSHDPDCEMEWILEAVYQRLNMTAYEASVLKQKRGLCFCYSRKVWQGQRIVPSPSARVDRIAVAVTLVMDMRMKNLPLQLDFEPVEKRLLELFEKKKVRGNVIPVDFQARKRLIDDQ